MTALPTAQELVQAQNRACANLKRVWTAQSDEFEKRHSLDGARLFIERAFIEIERGFDNLSSMEDLTSWLAQRHKKQYDREMEIDDPEFEERLKLKKTGGTDDSL